MVKKKSIKRKETRKKKISNNKPVKIKSIVKKTSTKKLKTVADLQQETDQNKSVFKIDWESGFKLNKAEHEVIKGIGKKINNTQSIVISGTKSFLKRQKALYEERQEEKKRLKELQREYEEEKEQYQQDLENGKDYAVVEYMIKCGIKKENIEKELDYELIRHLVKNGIYFQHAIAITEIFLYGYSKNEFLNSETTEKMLGGIKEEVLEEIIEKIYIDDEMFDEDKIDRTLYLSNDILKIIVKLPNKKIIDIIENHIMTKKYLLTIRKLWKCIYNKKFDINDFEDIDTHFRKKSNTYNINDIILTKEFWRNERHDIRHAIKNFVSSQIDELEVLKKERETIEKIVEENKRKEELEENRQNMERIKSEIENKLDKKEQEHEDITNEHRRHLEEIRSEHKRELEEIRRKHKDNKEY